MPNMAGYYVVNVEDIVYQDVERSRPLCKDFQRMTSDQLYSKTDNEIDPALEYGCPM